MNIKKLNEKINEKGMKRYKIAEHLGISYVTLHKRLKTGSFSVEDMNKLVGVLELSKNDTEEIFLPTMVTKRKLLVM